MQAATDCRNTDDFCNFSHLCVVHYGLVFAVFRAGFFLSTDCLVPAGVPLQLAMLSPLNYKRRYRKFVLFVIYQTSKGWTVSLTQNQKSKNSLKAWCKTPKSQCVFLIISIVFETDDKLFWSLTHSWDDIYKHNTQVFRNTKTLELLCAIRIMCH